MASIQRLSAQVVNKIAAGEVIERPASVVKELVENSLDAGAGRVDVALQRGGVESIRVADDGRGIPAAEMPLAIESHATSKIQDADDLFRVATLGFRGEALASIAAVSRFLLRSRPAECDSGGEIELVGGEWSAGPAPAPCGCPSGTAVEVKSLFFNTPVRRKFLKTTQTEMGHVSEAFTRLALAHPRVHFTLRHNGRLVHDLPPSGDWRERIAGFFGPELAEALIPIEAEDRDETPGGGCRLYGYVAPPSHSRGNNRSQYLFLNGRFIRHRSLQHALSEAYRGLLLTGRYPLAFLCFEMPPDAVDVNVHPTKLEVRFRDGGRLYGQLLGALRTKFLSADLTARWRPRGATEQMAVGAIDREDVGETASLINGAAEPPPDDPRQPASAHDHDRAEEVRRELVAWAQGKMADWDEPVAAGGFAAPADLSSRTPLRLNRLDDRTLPFMNASPAASSLEESSQPAASLDEPWEEEVPGEREVEREIEAAGFADGLPEPPALQVHNRYLVTEAAEGMVVIDQHALHERILYEQLREKALSGALECQQLLAPEAVELAPAEAAAVAEHRDLLAQLGFRVEPFGGGAVLISSYPAMLEKVNLAHMLREIVDQLLAAGPAPQRRHVLDKLLHAMSCQAAVKAGDPLSDDEIAALLQQRHLAHDSHHCPHGRPTALILTREELDRQFLRT